MGQNNPVTGVLFDLEGVLFIGNQRLDGALEAIETLKFRGIPYRFMTNTTTTSRLALTEKMHLMGFDVLPDEILTAPSAARLYLEQQGPLTCFPLVSDNVKSEFAGFPVSDHDPDVIIVGDIGPAWDYALINRLFAMLMAGARLVALHKGKYWQTDMGLQVDIGAFIAGLEYVSGQRATVIGKPSAAFFNAGVLSLECPKTGIVMVGDDIDADIGGAQDAGLQTALVKTGKYRGDAVVSSGITPDYLLDSVADIECLLTHESPA